MGFFSGLAMRLLGMGQRPKAIPGRSVDKIPVEQMIAGATVTIDTPMSPDELSAYQDAVAKQAGTEPYDSFVIVPAVRRSKEPTRKPGTRKNRMTRQPIKARKALKKAKAGKKAKRK